MADLTVKELVRQSYQNSADHGFWDGSEVPETIPSKLMLIVSELSEALESYRDPRADDMVKVPASVIEALLEPNFYGDASEGSVTIETTRAKAMAEIEAIYDKWKDKPKGFDTELADTFIRLGDLIGAKKIDIEAAIQRKHEYNIGREHMHGRKV